jgi:hypothetical protein
MKKTPTKPIFDIAPPKSRRSKKVSPGTNNPDKKPRAKKLVNSSKSQKFHQHPFIVQARGCRNKQLDRDSPEYGALERSLDSLAAHVTKIAGVSVPALSIND